MSVPTPEHDHLKMLVEMLSDWYSWLIFILVTIIVAFAKSVGKLSNTQIVPVYALQTDMVDCQKKLIDEFKGMRKDVNEKIDHAHNELRDDVKEVKEDMKGERKRIDILYQRDN